MIKTKNLCFSFWEIEILKNLNIEINSWEILKIFWPSGRWKTTLLKIIWGLISSYSWEIFFDSVNLKSLSKSNLDKFRWENIWFVFQDQNLIQSFSWKENIDLVFSIQKKQIDKSWADFLLKELEIWDFFQKKVCNLSGWQKERISICRAMIHKPNILLWDELWSNLDLRLKKKVYNLIYEYIKENKLWILITHDEELKNYKWQNFYLN